MSCATVLSTPRMAGKAAAIGVACVIMLASACGGDDESAGAGTETTTETTTTSESVAPDLVGLDPAQKGDKSPIAPNYRPGNYRTMSQFLTVSLNRVDAFWTQVYRNSGITPAPFVRYHWLPQGKSVRHKCTGPPTDDDTASFCPADDTIYIALKIARDFWQGFLGEKRAKVYPGAFGLAYVVAHEYAHNVQSEFGISSTGPTVKRQELQADCLAGVFANSEYYAGALDAGDVEGAISEADFLGDFQYTDPGHHGTPEERAAAWRLGYNTGQPDRCFNSYPA